jgi:3-hydroxyisobutyrate dehydrogenase-like beta-hydroxyacid dehydrogenase
MAARDFTPSFALTTARKDVRLMQELAGDVDTAVLAGLAARMEALIAEGQGDLDVGVLAR